MANIALNKPSGGQLILSPEDGTSTETVTIPSVGVGKVLQVVHHVSYTGRNTTSTSYVATGEEVSITPTSSTSKILVFVDAFISNTGAGYYTWIDLRRNGSSIHSNMVQVDASSFGQSGKMVGANVLDNPASASAVTYSIYFKSESSSQTARLTAGANNGSTVPPLRITLMEVAA